MSREQKAFCATLKNTTNESACVTSEYGGIFSPAYFACCLGMGVFFCVSYFLVRTPHFIVLSWAYSTTNVSSYGCDFLRDLLSSTNKAMRCVVQGVFILYVCRRVCFVRRSSQSSGVATYVYRIGKTTQTFIIYGRIHAKFIFVDFQPFWLIFGSKIHSNAHANNIPHSTPFYLACDIVHID